MGAAIPRGVKVTHVTLARAFVSLCFDFGPLANFLRSTFIKRIPRFPPSLSPLSHFFYCLTVIMNFRELRTRSNPVVAPPIDPIVSPSPSLPLFFSPTISIVSHVEEKFSANRGKLEEIRFTNTFMPTKIVPLLRTWPSLYRDKG